MAPNTAILYILYKCLNVLSNSCYQLLNNAHLLLHHHTIAACCEAQSQFKARWWRQPHDYRPNTLIRHMPDITQDDKLRAEHGLHTDASQECHLQDYKLHMGTARQHCVG